MANKPLTAEEMQRMGGNALYKKVGKKGMAERGKKAGEKNKAKGSDYFKRIRAIGVAKQKAKKKSSVDKFADYLTGGQG